MSIYRDPEKIVHYLEGWIRDRFGEANAKGAVLGISGGIDSALLAALLAKTIGAEKVTGVIMPCHSFPIDEEYARLLGEKFHINIMKVDLADSYDTVKAAIDAAGAELTGLSAANIKPRLRMITLYAIAQQKRCLVFGGGNKDEITMGYFTKYGDAGVDLLPLADLLKGEVWACAEYLGVPQQIIDRPPTAALWEGQTDESEMGITYKELDAFIANGEGTREIKEKVETAQNRSEHKKKFVPMAILPKDL